MKKLLIIIACLISLNATAQDQTLSVRKTPTGTVFGLDPNAVRDTLPRSTGILLNGKPLVYNSTTNKYTTTSLGVSGIDTTEIRTVANSVSLAGLQTRLNTKVTISPGAAQDGFINMSGNITSGATLYSSNAVFTNTIENNAAAYATGGYSLLVKNTGSNVFQTVPSTTFEAPLTFSSPLVRTTNAISLPLATSSVNGYLSATDRTNFQSAYTYSQVGHLPLTGGTLTGALTGTSATFNATVDDVLTLSNSGNRPRIRYNVASGALGALVGISSGPGIIFTSAGANYYAIRADYGINIGVGDVIAQTITTGGATTFEGAITGTSATLQSIKITNGASNGYVLKSDASGNASWQATTSSYKGTWDASTNTPTVADGVGAVGDYYEVSTGGTQFGRTFTTGGRAIYNGTIWEPVGVSASVTSVNGYTGTVVLAKSDIGLGSVDNTSDATKNSATATLTNKTISGATNTITSIPNSATTATTVNNSNTIVLRDTSGNFTAGTITGTLNGNASTATTATNATNWGGRSASLVGDTTTSLQFPVGLDTSGVVKLVPQAQLQSFLGLGSNAYTSTSYAPLASPALTGTPTAPTATAGTNTTQIATTAFVQNIISSKIYTGVITLSGNGTQTDFNTGIQVVGNLVLTAKSADAAGNLYIESQAGCGGLCNEWHIRFITAPPSGTNNIQFSYIETL